MSNENVCRYFAKLLGPIALVTEEFVHVNFGMMFGIVYYNYICSII